MSPSSRPALTRPPGMAVREEYDVVAVGAGTGGLVAAITAAHLGLRALLVEKTPLLGGVTAYSQGQMWLAASDEALAAGVEDSPGAGLAYLRRLGMGFGDPGPTAAYCTEGPGVLRFLRDNAGVPWRLVDLADYYYPEFPEALPTGRYLEVDPYFGPDLGPWRPLLRVSPHVPYRLTHDVLYSLPAGARAHTWDPEVLASREARDELAMGTGLAAHLLHAAVAFGVDVAARTEVRALRRTGGRVDGVLLDRGGDLREVGARRAVVLATGGYDWNDALARAFEGNLGMSSSAPPSVVGDHLRLATSVGARLDQAPKSLRLGIPVPGEDDGRPMSRILGAMAMPHALLVDRTGRRFGDESFYPSIGQAVRTIDGKTQTTPHWPCWVVFDEAFRRRYALGGAVPGQPLPEELGVVVADSPAELATAVGIDPDGLVDELARFNGFCETGVDLDFGRGDRPWARRNYGDPEVGGNPCLGPVATAPFYAFRPGLVGAGIAATGVATDEHGQARDWDDQPVPGLYVVGNSAMLHEVGAGYQSGVANTRAAVFAHLGVRHACGA